MSLENVQLFLATYLRDPRVRRLFRTGDPELLRELQLSPADHEFVKGINLADLDRAAQDFMEERSRKRTAEFTPFVNHLAAFGPIDQFFEMFDAAHPDGQLNRPLEMDRFLGFAADFVTGQGLPSYLLDLLRFSYHCSSLAETPREQLAEPVRDAVPEAGLEAYHRIHLRRPYRLVTFRYDVLRLAQSDPSQAVNAPPEPTLLFLQKSWTLAKRTIAIDVRELPFLTLLVERPQAVVDLVGLVPPYEVGSSLQHIQDLVRRGIVWLSVPAHFGDAPKRG